MQYNTKNDASLRSHWDAHHTNIWWNTSLKRCLDHLYNPYHPFMLLGFNYDMLVSYIWVICLIHVGKYTNFMHGMCVNAYNSIIIVHPSIYIYIYYTVFFFAFTVIVAPKRTRWRGQDDTPLYLFEPDMDDNAHIRFRTTCCDAENGTWEILNLATE